MKAFRYILPLVLIFSLILGACTPAALLVLDDMVRHLFNR